MEEGKQGVMVAAQNSIAQLQAWFKDLENGFRGWLAKQFLPVEAAVVTATSAAQGAAIGAFIGTLIHYACYVYVHMIFIHRVYNFINNNKNK